MTDARAETPRQKMIQPNPDEPCQWCGATAHPEPIRCQQGKECPHCHGIHWGSVNCPFSETQLDRPEPKPWPKPPATLREVLQKGVELVESAFAHVSHGGPTRADAEKWIQEAKDALKAG
jgi:hypothetical protein